MSGSSSALMKQPPIQSTAGAVPVRNEKGEEGAEGGLLGGERRRERERGCWTQLESLNPARLFQGRFPWRR